MQLEAMKIDFHGMNHNNSSVNNGNKLLLDVVDRAAGFLFAYPMSSNAAVGGMLLGLCV